MNDTIEETEDQAAARILAWRCSKALTGAGDLTLHVRSLALNGKTERGETLPEWSAPMRITAVDDVDAMYAQLINWVGFWSEALNSPPPSTAIVAWSNTTEPQGFRAGTSPLGARMLVQLLAMWLNVQAEAIEGHESAEVYRKDIVELLGTLRGRYPLAARPPKPISLRPCPVCDHNAVGAEWGSEDMLDVTVQCEHCGHVLPAAKPSELARWLS